VKHPIPRVGKGVPGFGIERAPSCEGVSALDHQATPAALPMSLSTCRATISNTASLSSSETKVNAGIRSWA
jgi:hypothetical protein